ncbi:hypothetical protein Pcinc_007835 [Petrolisthes cinctipes]|uniref:TBC1 domain family member 23 n=1 Tax=Petrolisthes cinctipes TaxID=88211 RepID=A0AAE1KY63_PETCI|nr:hypothetical protein Pcinc_007835 [Petrolisthes cinctipes]
MEEEDGTWVLALEAALHEGADDCEIIAITRGRPLPEEHRAQIWATCLAGGRVNNFSQFDEIFDLPEQSLVRSDCTLLVDKLGNEEEDKISVVSEVESVFTHYCKSRHLRYDTTRRWADIILPLLACRMPPDHLYLTFEQILEKFVPRETGTGAPVYHLLRLLLLYHDPELSTFLDSHKITPDTFAVSWVRSVFSSVVSLDAVIALWDIYFQERDPFFVLFLALVVLVNAREQILGLKAEERTAIINTLTVTPAALTVHDAQDFCSLARYYMLRTPTTFRETWQSEIYGSVYLGDVEVSGGGGGSGGVRREVGDLPLPQALCLPVSSQEILTSLHDPQDDPHDDPQDQVRFFLIDCRPAEQYNAGHLPNAFHLDAGLMLQQPASFQTAVQGLFLAQRQALTTKTPGCGHHLCLMGSGDMDQDQYVHMVCASFLQRYTSLVSLAQGGYKALHDLLSGSLAESLSEHDPAVCLACRATPTPGLDHQHPTPALSLNQSDSEAAQGPSLVTRFSSLSSLFRARSTEMKTKLVDYITNPGAEGGGAGGSHDHRHISSLDRGRLYRNQADVFSIEDVCEDEEGLEEKRIASFLCQHVSESGSMTRCQLVVTMEHLLVVMEDGRVVTRRSLSSVVKITSKKKHPDLITFKFGHTTEDGQPEITDMDRFLIPRAGEATKVIKEQILKQMEATLS